MCVYLCKQEQLHQTQQPSPQQQPPPYHIAKAFTKKTKQDLLIYDIYRTNYQHQQVTKSIDQQFQNDRQDNSLSTQEPSDTNSTTSNSFNVVDSDNNEITANEANTNEINTIESINHSRDNSLLQSKTPWLFGEHKNPTVVNYDDFILLPNS